VIVYAIPRGRELETGGLNKPRIQRFGTVTKTLMPLGQRLSLERLRSPHPSSEHSLQRRKKDEDHHRHKNDGEHERTQRQGPALNLGANGPKQQC
jgi:hypothetical protein